MVNRALPPFEPRALRLTVSDPRTEVGTNSFGQ
jgi:hypothetical protein